MKNFLIFILVLNCFFIGLFQDDIVVEEFVQEEKIKLNDNFAKKIPELNDEQKTELELNLCITFLEKYIKDESETLNQIVTKFDHRDNILSEKIYYMILNKCMKSITFDETIRLLSKGKEYAEKNYKDYTSVNFTILENNDDLILNKQETETKEMFQIFKQKVQDMKNKNDGKKKNEQNKEDYNEKDQTKEEENHGKSDNQNNRTKFYENEGEIKRNNKSSKPKNRKSKQESSLLYDIFTNTEFIIFISLSISITIIVVIISCCCCTKPDTKKKDHCKNE